jgi:hypothetical protein
MSLLACWNFRWRFAATAILALVAGIYTALSSNARNLAGRRADDLERIVTPHSRHAHECMKMTIKEPIP